MSLPHKYISGLVVGYTSVSTVTINVGVCRDSSNRKNMVSESAIVVSIASSGANGLDTGAEASNTWYYVWLISDKNGANLAGLLSTSSTAPTMPSTYTLKRLVGAVRNGSGSDFLDFKSFGTGSLRRYHWNTLVTDRRVLTAGTDGSMTDVDCAAYIPTGFAACIAHLAINANTAAADVYLRPNGSSVTLTHRARLGASSNHHLSIATDASSVIEYQRNAGTGTVDIDVEGFDYTV